MKRRVKVTTGTALQLRKKKGQNLERSGAEHKDLDGLRSLTFLEGDKKTEKTFEVNLKVFHRMHQQNKLGGILVHCCIKAPLILHFKKKKIDMVYLFPFN